MAVKGKKKKKIIKRIIITVIILAILAAIVTAFVINSQSANAMVEEKPVIGSLTTYYTFSGNVESKNTSTLLSEKPEQISTIKVAEGDKVSKDKVLFVTSMNEEIKAKTAGTITNIYVDENQQVAAGMKLANIVDFDALQVTIKVDEYDLSSIALNKEVEVTVSAIDKKINGKISKISQTATIQNSVSYFTAVIDLGMDSTIKVGMSCEAKIINKQVTDVVTISMNALQFDNNNTPYVMVKDGESKPLKQIFIPVGVNDGIRVEVKEGLAITDTVVYKKIVKQAASALFASRSTGSSGSSSSSSTGTGTGNSSSFGG